MLSKRFGNSVYHQLVFIGYFGLAVGMPLSKIILSLSMMWLALILVLQGDFKRYVQRIKSNDFVLLLLALWAWSLLTFAWSSDLDFALKDFKDKLPLFIIPLLFVAQPLDDNKQYRVVLGGFVVAVLVTSVINVGSYVHLWGDRVYDDIRGMSLFISHIRFALMVSTAAAIAGLWFQKSKHRWKWVGLVLFGWFSFYTYYAQVLSGVLTFGGVIVVWIALELSIRKNRVLSKVVIFLGILGVGVVTYALVVFFQPEKLRISLDHLPEKTKEGNLYFHRTDKNQLENGYPVYYFLCQEEMKREWNRLSSFPYDSLDAKGQKLEGTLIRYLTSKGLYKDATGVQALSPTDISHIEQGIPSILSLKKGFGARLAGLKNELMYSNDPNGQSIAQRFEYWKTGLKILKSNFLLGVGAGDIDRAFQQQYEHDKSKLRPENRLRTHNQYLSFFIALGLVGFLLFVATLIYFWRTNFKQRNYLAILFLTISLLSFLVEDTLETQMGVTFFAFFFGLFISYSERRIWNEMEPKDHIE